MLADRGAVSGRIENARKPWPPTSTAATAMVVADWVLVRLVAVLLVVLLVMAYLRHFLL
jgi:hypothetical protein